MLKARLWRQTPPWRRFLAASPTRVSLPTRVERRVVAELSATIGRNVSEVADCVDSLVVHATAKSGLSLRRGWAVALPAYKASAELRKTTAVIGAVAASSLHKLREDPRERPWAADGERLRMRTRALRDRDVPLTQIARAVSPVSLGGGCRAAAGNGGAPLQARALPSAPYAQTATRRHRRAGIRFGLIRISDDGRAVVSAGSRRRQYSGSTCANRHGVATSYDVDRTQKSDRLLLAVSLADLLSL